MSLVIPVILISGHGDQALEGMATTAGAVRYLHKPVRVRDLLEAIGEFEGVKGASGAGASPPPD